MTAAQAHVSKDSIQKSKEGAAKEAAKLGRETLGNAGDVSNQPYIILIVSPHFNLRQTTSFARSPSLIGRH